MAHDVFISYSSENKSIANKVLTTLENRKIRCWIAPRDIPPGKLYGASLINAIKAAQIMVLVLSKGTNHSEYVVRELNEAVANGLTIISFRIEEVEPSENLGFYINSTQWLDAIEPPMDNHLNKLADSVGALLSVGEIDQLSGTEPVYQEPVKKRSAVPMWTTALIVIAAVVIIGGIGIWAFSLLGSGTSPTSPTEFATQAEVPSDEDQSGNLPQANSEQEAARDWRSLSFIFPQPQLWREPVEGRYTTIGQHSMDAFAWSTKKVDGDLTLTFDLERPESESDGCVIIYGDGNEHSYGSLIFCVDWDGYFLEKHTVYYDDGDENLLNYAFNDNETDEVYSVRIEINDDLAIMNVNGEDVLSTIFDKQEIDRSGRIGLFKKWFIGEITFSDIQVKTSNENN